MPAPGSGTRTTVAGIGDAGRDLERALTKFNDLGYNHFFVNAKVSTDRFIIVSILTSYP
jgi:hypothetical protein